ncbi:MAG: type IV secretory system conjugative DNA transfer family protein, partial [Micropruina sp.]
MNDDMDRAPHTLIVGPTGAGKTTLATAIMGDRGGRSIVITPKVSAGGWRGAEVVSLDDDGSYAPLQAALRDLEDEKRQRIVALRQHGRDGLEPLTVVFDELQDLTAHVPEAGAFMVNMASLGREIKVRMVGVGTSDEALNVRGWAASRRNYLRVELDRDRRATLNDGVRTIAVSTRESLRAAE